MRELLRDFFVMLQLLLILGRRDDGHPLRAALFGLPHLDQLHAIRLGGQLLPPGRELRVGGELVIVADLESESLLRSRQVARRLSRRLDYECYRQRRSRQAGPCCSFADGFHPCALILLMISVLLVDNSWRSINHAKKIDSAADYWVRVRGASSYYANRARRPGRCAVASGAGSADSSARGISVAGRAGELAEGLYE